MKNLFVIATSIVILGFFISEKFLATVTGVTLGTYYFSIPLICLFLFRPGFPRSKFFSIILVLYIGILTLILVKDNFQNFHAYYGIGGGTFIGWILAGRNFDGKKAFKIIQIFGTLSLIVSSSYFFGVWDGATGRVSFLGQNINVMGHILCIGLTCFWYVSNYLDFTKNKNILRSLLILCFIPTILATVSRTAIFAMVLVILVFLFNNYGKKLFLISTFLALVIYANVEYLSQIRAVKKVEARSENVEQDPRVTLFLSAYAFLSLNPYTGGGLKMFHNMNEYKDANIGAIDHKGNFKAMSIHNSFLDLAIIGGFGFMLFYTIILFNMLIVGIKFILSNKKDVKNVGAFVISNFVIAFSFSATGQAFYQKYTWWAIGVSYLLIALVRTNKLNSHLKLKNSNKQSDLCVE